MVLPRGWGGGAAGRSPPALAALSQVLRLERSRRIGVVFPLEKLARSLAPGADTARFRLFQPGLAALQRAETLFRSGRDHAIDYVSSAVRMDHAPPPALPEVRTKTGGPPPLRLPAVPFSPAAALGERLPGAGAGPGRGRSTGLGGTRGAPGAAAGRGCPGRWPQRLRAAGGEPPAQDGCRQALSASPAAGVLHRPKQRGEIVLNPGLVFAGSRSGGQSVKNSGKRCFSLPSLLVRSWCQPRG